MSTIFEQIQFCNDVKPIKENKTEKEYTGYILQEGVVIKNCDFLVTEELINECFGNEELIERAVLTEGAKADWLMKNFLKEGKDYKGLKKDLKEIISANNMSDENLKSKGKGFLHICKRVLQVCEDIGAITSTAGNAASIVSGIVMGTNPIILVGMIVGTVVGFICNRLFRLLWDTVEFHTIKEDAESIVDDLKRMAKNADNPKVAEKYTKEAEKLEESIKKYSNKSDEEALGIKEKKDNSDK